MDASAGRATVQVRGLRFAAEFAQHGWDAEFVDIEDVGEAGVLQRARGVLLVYLIKIRSLALVRALKRQGAKIVFDLTDPLWELRFRRGGWWDIDEILTLSDAVFSENEYVCSYGRRFNKRVIGIPVCTQVERFERLRAACPRPPTDRIVIGWVGSPSTIKAITKMVPVIEEVSRRHPQVEFRLVGTGGAQIPVASHVRLTSVGTYDEDAMIREIFAMHIGIYPPPADLYDYRVRGAHKALLYMTAGIATVALNTGDCAAKIRDGETGLLANNDAEWADKLSWLVRFPERRADIAARGAESVRAEHSLQNVFSHLERALETVIQNPRAPWPTLFDRAKVAIPKNEARLRYFWQRASAKMIRLARNAFSR